MKKLCMTIVGAGVLLMGSTSLATAEETAQNKYAREMCDSVGWRNLGYATYRDCFNDFYNSYYGPDGPGGQ